MEDNVENSEEDCVEYCCVDNSVEDCVKDRADDGVEVIEEDNIERRDCAEDCVESNSVEG